jgi:hypothetical protein
MTPQELLAALDDETLDPAAFHHAEHVAAAWAAVHEADAEERMCIGLRNLAARAGRAERYDRQLTLSFVRLIRDRVEREPQLDWPSFRETFPELFDKERARGEFSRLDGPSHEDSRDRRSRR